jgi:hypothetical protein
MQGPQKVAQMFTIVSLLLEKMLSSTAFPSRSVAEKELKIPSVSGFSLAVSEVPFPSSTAADSVASGEVPESGAEQETNKKNTKSKAAQEIIFFKFNPPYRGIIFM